MQLLFLTSIFLDKRPLWFCRAGTASPSLGTRGFVPVDNSE